MLPLLYLWQWCRLCCMYVCILSIYIAMGNGYVSMYFIYLYCPWAMMSPGRYVCMYLCVYASIYLSIYLYTHTTHTHVHACMHARTYTRTRTYTHTHSLSQTRLSLSSLTSFFSLTLSPFPLSLSPSLSISLSLSGCNGQSAERREGGLQTNSCRNCRWVQGPEIGILSFWSMICAHVLRP